MKRIAVSQNHARPEASAQGIDPIVSGALLPTLVRLTLPNLVALLSLTMVAAAETSLIGRLGAEALAAMALVFPTITFMQTLAVVGLGGGTASAIARALGAGDRERAHALAMHAIAIALLVGAGLTIAALVGRQQLYALLGGRGPVLALATDYAGAFFAGTAGTWLFYTLVAIVRGTGNMRLPSNITIAISIVQIVLGAVLSLGLAGAPRLGLVGIGLAQAAAHALGAASLLVAVCRSSSRLPLRFRGTRPSARLARDILGVGLVACLSPVQAILAVLILSHVAATLGTTALAAFGIGARLELLLTPIAYAVGTASVPMIGMAIGAGLVQRARRVAWTAALLAGLAVGLVSAASAITTELWTRPFTSDARVIAELAHYLDVAGIGFPLYAFGISLFLSSQGAGRVAGPLLGGTARLALVAVGGWWIVRHHGSLGDLALVILASLAGFALVTSLFVAASRWAPRGAQAGPGAPMPRR